MRSRRLDVIRAVAGITALALVAVGFGGSGDVDAAPVDTTIEVVLALARDQSGLERAALRRNDPASDDYGAFLSVDEIASRFGADAEARSAVKHYFEGRSRRVSFDAAGGFAVVELTVGQATKAFSVEWATGTTPQGVAYVGPADPPRVPMELRRHVDAVLSTTQELDSHTVTRQSADTGGQDDASCEEARDTVARAHARYGIADLAATGLDGTGIRIAVVSLGTFDSYAYSLWASCLAIEAPVQPIQEDVDISIGLAEEGELDVDVDTIVAVTPHLSALDLITVDEFGWVGEPFAAALGDLPGGPPDVISSSIGFCESDLDAPSVELAEYSLAALAAVGTSVVAASGDAGSACAPGSRDVSVQYPASSAFVVAVGGTQLATNDTEVTWFEPGQYASGGGTSALIDPPDYQRGRGHRVLPDVALLASPFDLPSLPVCSADTCAWQSKAGTSAAAPMFAGAVAQLKQTMREEGKIPVGLLNPLLYRSTDASNIFDDVTRGSNDLHDIGCCRAKRGFDLTTGWGAPDVAELARYALAMAPDSARRDAAARTEVLKRTNGTPA